MGLKTGAFTKSEFPGFEAPEIMLKKSLDLALPGQDVIQPVYLKTRTRKITRRGIMWVGQTCNLRCRFCYYKDRIEDFHHPEHSFMTADKAKSICKVLVDVYNNNSVDIQGGEPTIWEGIFELVSYCREIGLAPTVITNALVLDNKELVLRYKEAGIRDFLISVHGIGDVYDWIVGLQGAHVRQMNALRNLQEAGVPFRFNCVLSKVVLPQLPYIAELGVRTGARVVNFLAFNPFDDQRNSGNRSSVNVPTYTEIGSYLNKALDVLSDQGVEGNVRYLPLCVVDERHRQSAYTFRQLPFDVHENDFASWFWTGLQPQRLKEGKLSSPPEFGSRLKLGFMRHFLRRLGRLRAFGPALIKTKHHLDHLWAKTTNSISNSSKEEKYLGDARLRAHEHCDYRYGEACSACDVREICDGFHGDYADFFGTEEARPVRIGRPVDDPKFFINQQEKSVYPDDKVWMESGNY